MNDVVLRLLKVCPSLSMTSTLLSKSTTSMLRLEPRLVGWPLFFFVSMFFFEIVSENWVLSESSLVGMS